MRATHISRSVTIAAVLTLAVAIQQTRSVGSPHSTSDDGETASSETENKPAEAAPTAEKSIEAPTSEAPKAGDATATATAAKPEEPSDTTLVGSATSSTLQAALPDLKTTAEGADLDRAKALTVPKTEFEQLLQSDPESGMAAYYKSLLDDRTQLEALQKQVAEARGQLAGKPEIDAKQLQLLNTMDENLKTALAALTPDQVGRPNPTGAPTAAAQNPPAPVEPAKKGLGETLLGYVPDSWKKAASDLVDLLQRPPPEQAPPPREVVVAGPGNTSPAQAPNHGAEGATAAVTAANPAPNNLSTGSGTSTTTTAPSSSDTSAPPAIAAAPAAPVAEAPANGSHASATAPEFSASAPPSSNSNFDAAGLPIGSAPPAGWNQATLGQNASVISPLPLRAPASAPSEPPSDATVPGETNRPPQSIATEPEEAPPLGGSRIASSARHPASAMDVEENAGGPSSATLPPIPEAVVAKRPNRGNGGSSAASSAVANNGSPASAGGFNSPSAVIVRSSDGSASGGSVLSTSGPTAPSWMTATLASKPPADGLRVNLLTNNDFAAAPAGASRGVAASYGPAAPGENGTTAFGPLPWKNEPPVASAGPAAANTTVNSPPSSSANGTPWRDATITDARRLERAAAAAAKPMVVLAKVDLPESMDSVSAKGVPPRPLQIISGEEVGEDDADGKTPKGLRITAGNATAESPLTTLPPRNGPRSRAATKSAYKQPSSQVAKALPTPPTARLTFAGRAEPVTASSPPVAPAAGGSDLSRFRQGSGKK